MTRASIAIFFIAKTSFFWYPQIVSPGNEPLHRKNPHKYGEK
jgi:hypothetical protein